MRLFKNHLKSNVIDFWPNFNFNQQRLSALVPVIPELPHYEVTRSKRSSTSNSSSSGYSVVNPEANKYPPKHQNQNRDQPDTVNLTVQGSEVRIQNMFARFFPSSTKPRNLRKFPINNFPAGRFLHQEFRGSEHWALKSWVRSKFWIFSRFGTD